MMSKAILLLQAKSISVIFYCNKWLMNRKKYLDSPVTIRCAETHLMGVTGSVVVPEESDYNQAIFDFTSLHVVVPEEASM